MSGLAFSIFSQLGAKPSPLLNIPTGWILENLSDFELKNRFYELVNSQWIINEFATPVPLLLPEMPVWASLITCYREIIMRGLNISELLRETDERIGVEQKSLAGKLKSAKSPVLVDRKLTRFGGFSHLKAFLDTGEILLNPASKYLDKNLTAAQQDDEITFTTERHPSEVKISALDKSKQRFVQLEPIGNVKFQTTAPTNFYMYCLSKLSNTRLLFDFKADTCFVFDNPQFFLEKLNLELGRKLPGWKAGMLEVLYNDIYDISFKPIPFRTKDITYHYQFETRVVCLPPIPNAVTVLDPIKLHLGPMNEAGRLIPLL
jgi:hypothetical protein